MASIDHPEKSLLIADDQLEICEMVREVARSVGFNPRLATSARNFFDLYRRESPALIMLDLQLRGLDGVELLRSLAEVRCQSGIVIMSSLDPRILESAARLARCLKLNLVGTLHKPLAVDRLHQTLIKETLH